MIAGTEADSIYFSEEAASYRSREAAEGAIWSRETHNPLYNYVDRHVQKSIDFLTKHLARMSTYIRSVKDILFIYSLE